MFEIEKKEKKKEESAPWDKKRILIGTLFILVIFFASLYFKTVFFSSKPTTAVEGAYTHVATAQDQEIGNASSKLQDQVDQIKNNVNDLNMVDVATSSPQVQKVLDDIKSLQDLPRDQARDACQKICSGL